MNMRIAAVPIAFIIKANHMDANFFIGNDEERAIAQAKKSIRFAKKRLTRAKAALKKRNALRKKLGIRVRGM